MRYAGILWVRMGFRQIGSWTTLHFLWNTQVYLISIFCMDLCVPPQADRTFLEHHIFDFGVFDILGLPYELFGFHVRLISWSSHASPIHVFRICMHLQIPCGNARIHTTTQQHNTDNTHNTLRNMRHTRRTTSQIYNNTNTKRQRSAKHFLHNQPTTRRTHIQLCKGFATWVHTYIIMKQYANPDNKLNYHCTIQPYDDCATCTHKHNCTICLKVLAHRKQGCPHFVQKLNFVTLNHMHIASTRKQHQPFLVDYFVVDIPCMFIMPACAQDEFTCDLGIQSWKHFGGLKSPKKEVEAKNIWWDFNPPK